MNSKPMDDFLSTDRDGHLTKTDEGFKKDDELPRLKDPSEATEFPPMDHKVEELGDEGSPLTDALNAIVEDQKSKKA